MSKADPYWDIVVSGGQNKLTLIWTDEFEARAADLEFEPPSPASPKAERVGHASRRDGLKPLPRSTKPWGYGVPKLNLRFKSQATRRGR